MADIPKSDPPLQARVKPEIKTVYSQDDLSTCDHDREVNYPGQLPFTRGIQPTMYRGRLWTMRQYAGMGDAEESNKRYRYLRSEERRVGKECRL